jgi:hypothetical protein
MDLRATLETLFDGKTFDQPLYYSYEGGLRFELSEGGTPIDQVFVALTKAKLICDAIFEGQERIGVCLRLYGPEKLMASKRNFEELKKAGIRISRDRCIWSTRVPVEDVPEYALEDALEEDVEEFWHHFAFFLPESKLLTLLWCALVGDWGTMSPNPGFLVYLFSVEQQLLVLPYDDRGMDAVGPNHEALRSLYRRFNEYLLDYDRPEMDAVFEW